MAQENRWLGLATLRRFTWPLAIQYCGGVLKNADPGEKEGHYC